MAQEEAVDGAEEAEIVGGVDIARREDGDDESRGGGQRRSTCRAASQRRQAEQAEDEIGSELGADAPGGAVPGQSVMDAEGIQQEEVGHERGWLVVAGEGGPREMPHEGVGRECCDLQADPGHQHDGMQRPDPAEAQRHETAELAAIGDPARHSYG